ncbi:MAG: bacillithiol biosynthesis cysteine-adding enzyme BshC [Acidobacteriaceae bacterium]
MCLQSDCIGFREVPGASRIFLDYLAGSPRALRFYGSPSVLTKPIHHHSPEHLAELAETLLEQNRRFGASAATLSNIERLRRGAPAVVTGQQVGILGGPALSILKTLSAIKLAAAHGAVPVFWLATTDHDVAEIDHAHLICDGKLERVSASLQSASGAMVSHARLVAPVLSEEELERCYPERDSGIRSWIDESYRSGERVGIAFAKLWARLFGEYGVILVDPDDPLLPVTPPLMAAAEHAVELNSELRNRSRQLKEAGYHEQVLVTDVTTLLFAEIEGARTPIRISRELTGDIIFKAGGLSWGSAAELAAWVSKNVAKTTPNALLRPVVQDYLLPTIAYVGGPAELAYFAQSSVIYEKLLGGTTPILTRASATIVEPRIGQLLAKYSLSFSEIFSFHSEEELAVELSRRSQSGAIEELFAETRVRLGGALEALAGQLTKEDPTLRGAAETAFRKIEHQLQTLESRSARARLRREQVIARHAGLLWNNLHPRNSLQEREICGAHYLLKYGAAFIQILADRLTGSCPGHQIVRL